MNSAVFQENVHEGRRLVKPLQRNGGDNSTRVSFSLEKTLNLLMSPKCECDSSAADVPKADAH